MIAGLPDFPMPLPNDVPIEGAAKLEAARPSVSRASEDMSLLPGDFALALEASLTAQQPDLAPINEFAAPAETKKLAALVGTNLPEPGKESPDAPAQVGEAIEASALAKPQRVPAPAQPVEDTSPTRDMLVERSAQEVGAAAAAVTTDVPLNRPAEEIRPQGDEPTLVRDPLAERASALKEPPVSADVERTDPGKSASIQTSVENTAAANVEPTPDVASEPKPKSRPDIGAAPSDRVASPASARIPAEPVEIPATLEPKLPITPQPDPAVLKSTPPMPTAPDTERMREKLLPGRLASAVPADLNPKAKEPAAQVTHQSPVVLEKTEAAANTQSLQSTTTGTTPATAAPTATVTVQPSTEARFDARPAPQIEQAIEQLSEARDTVRSARPEILMKHGDFGLVSMRLDAASGDLRATLSARDPGFVPAVQAALSERVVTASQESASTSGQRGHDQGASSGNMSGQNAQSDPRYGSSPGSSQGSYQPQSGHQRLATSEPEVRDHTGANPADPNGQAGGDVFA